MPAGLCVRIHSSASSHVPSEHTWDWHSLFMVNMCFSIFSPNHSSGWRPGLILALPTPFYMAGIYSHFALGTTLGAYAHTGTTMSLPAAYPYPPSCGIPSILRAGGWYYFSSFYFTILGQPFAPIRGYRLILRIVARTQYPVPLHNAQHAVKAHPKRHECVFPSHSAY